MKIINMNNYVTLPVEERTKLLQDYITEHNELISKHSNKHVGQELKEMTQNMTETLVTVFTQQTELTKLLVDLKEQLLKDSLIDGSDEEKLSEHVNALLYTIQLMNEQDRMLLLGLIAGYEQDIETEMATTQFLIDNV